MQHSDPGVGSRSNTGEPSVQVSSSQGVRVITIARSQKRNAIDRPTAVALAAAFDGFDADEASSVAVLTGAGGYFSAGADLLSVARGDIPVLEGRGFAGITRRPPVKPVIAAVEGYAYAGGFELALACDLIVASATASFALPEARRGLIAAGGGLLRLPDRIPYHVAMEMALLGEPITAARLAELGLVNRVTEPGNALEVALELARKIQLSGPVATRTAKRIISQSRCAATESRFAEQERIVAPLRSGPEAREGALAFVEHREPAWANANAAGDTSGNAGHGT
jgi:enoyl-CoA hydratase